MAESSDIPTGTYTLTLGQSFESPPKGRKADPKSAQFHTLRYDFKPGSVSNEAETYIAFGTGGDVHVAVPNDGDNMTVYKGSKKEAKPKECLLFFDKTTNTVRLEKITTNLNVKKTRDLDPGAEQALKKGIERLRTTSSHRMSPSPPPEKPKSNPKVPESSDSSSDSDGSSDSDKSNGDSSDDEDESALLAQMTQSRPAPAAPAPAPPSVSNSYQNYQESSNHMPSAYSSSNSRDKGNSERYGLALSESSEEDD